MKEHKLLRIKITLECEVVGDDIYMSPDIQKAGEGISGQYERYPLRRKRTWYEHKGFRNKE